MRSAEVERETGETEVTVNLAIGGDGGLEGSSGIRFLDHVLESLTHHGDLALDLAVSGDVDPHHRTEDVAIALGRALREAAGDEIHRFGDARVPMDESLASVALDVSGRSYASVDLPEGDVGELPVTIFEHFLRSLADEAGITLHVETEGEDMHHAVEATFKCLAVALRQALRPREGVRSTKGVLD